METGTRYRGVGATIDVGATQGPFTIGTGTLVDRTTIIGQGRALDVVMWITFHITKIDGENVVIFDRLRFECRG